MIVAGAGGHGLEVAFLLQELGFTSSEIYYFDEDVSKAEYSSEKDSLILEGDALNSKLKQDPRFVLGVGNPSFREKLFHFLTKLGGTLYGMSCVAKPASGNSTIVFDAMPYSFIGPDTKIGLGVLVNTRAHVHHECVIGDFSEIGPGAMLLGGCKIGKKCRIGAGAVVLPGVELGNEVIVGAGAVVTRSVLHQSVLVGIPAQPVT
ncbi:acetyltransferase [Algoriphagus persicinus]|uniref:acetyltransferase n=1 Tax=Algoriphagus persicinus TaxID=3108754 RepID=UPI002B39AB02|nr:MULTISPECIES: acetyltransferase [unclassified Algoriphagus]MEB2779637.1 acetyltransferase [Algoriphagus sp. C2-6-M1]MEB2785162.1 acetyltransferase [Algoriphagus sp. E1-3-M2]